MNNDSFIEFQTSQLSKNIHLSEINEGVIAVAEERRRLELLYEHKLKCLDESVDNAIKDARIKKGVDIGKGAIYIGGVALEVGFTVAAKPGIALAIKKVQKFLLGISDNVRIFLGNCLEKHEEKSIVSVLTNYETGRCEDISIKDRNILKDATEEVLLNKNVVENNGIIARR